MADSPGQRLAGIFGPRFRDAMAVPQEDVSVKLARLLQGMGQQPQAPTPAHQQPFTGLRNEPQTLPPFEPPGSDFAAAMPPIAPTAVPTPPTAATQPQTLPAAAPLLSPVDPAAAAQGGDQPTVKADVLAAVQQMLAQQLLPEHWRGSFSTPPGMPR